MDENIGKCPQTETGSQTGLPYIISGPLSITPFYIWTFETTSAAALPAARRAARRLQRLSPFMVSLEKYLATDFHDFTQGWVSNTPRVCYMVFYAYPT